MSHIQPGGGSFSFDPVESCVAERRRRLIFRGAFAATLPLCYSQNLSDLFAVSTLIRCRMRSHTGLRGVGSGAPWKKIGIRGGGGGRDTRLISAKEKEVVVLAQLALRGRGSLVAELSKNSAKCRYERFQRQLLRP